MKVSGKIVDSTGSLAGAPVALVRNNEYTSVWTTSDDDGTFNIENDNIEPNDIFEIRFLGYKTQTKKASELQNVEILLVEDTEELDEVLITAKIGQKPKPDNSKTADINWYNKPVFLFSILGVATLGAILFIIKKSK